MQEQSSVSRTMRLDWKIILPGEYSTLRTKLKTELKILQERQKEQNPLENKTGRLKMKSITNMVGVSVNPIKP